MCVFLGDVMEIAYIEALNAGLLSLREQKGRVRDEAVLREAELLASIAEPVPVPRSVVHERAVPTTIPPPSWRKPSE